MPSQKNKLKKNIFRSNSKTYYFSSIFFPKIVREQVFTLYAFVRTADDFVDQIPQDKKGFYAFCAQCRIAEQGGQTENWIINDMYRLARACKFDYAWINSFLDAMRQDLTKKKYKTLDDTIQYMYGSAEVIGLFMAKIMRLDKESYHAARMLGRSMQYINFIRDVAEDKGLGRTYLPAEFLEKIEISEFSKEEISGREDIFIDFMRKQIDTYFTWVKEAEDGFSYIPKTYLIPIKTASDMYKWTAQTIYKNPMIVFDKKVKPSKWRVIRTALKNTAFL